MKRVGIFSGTFDPVHNGHLQFAHDALAQCELDKIFFLVEPRPRRKQGVKAFEHRLEMVRLAVKDEPHFGNIVLEQARFTPQGTLPPLEARFKSANLYLLMGDDMLNHLGDWPHVDELVSRVQFIIGVRGGEAKALSYIKALEQTRGLDLKYNIFKSKFASVSSSLVKTDLRKNAKTKNIPGPVLNYIRANKLYGSSTAS